LLLIAAAVVLLRPENPRDDQPPGDPDEDYEDVGRIDALIP
jgi:hypothetical protein